jgi:hypothetical protein
MVEHVQHVVVVADLALAGRVLGVGRAARDLVPHLAEVHVDARVALDQVLKLLQDRDQLLARVGVDMVDLVLEPLAVHAVVSR